MTTFTRRRLLGTAVAGAAVLAAGGTGLAIASQRGVPTASTTTSGSFLTAETIHALSFTVDQAAVTSALRTFKSNGTKEWIEATVTIDGEAYRRAGIRLKGNSSLRSASESSTPQSLPWLVRLDKYVDGTSHHGVTSLIVRSNTSTSSLNEAVALSLLGDAGLATQQAAYVKLSVNGSAEVLRLAVENPDDAWVSHAFATDGLLYKAEASGDWSYRGDAAASYKDIFDQESGEADLTPLIGFLQFINQSSDTDFKAGLGSRLDIDAFATYLAFEELLDNFDDIDGPGNNSYLWWARPSTHWTVVAWDHNLAFGAQAGMGGQGGGRQGQPGAGQAQQVPQGQAQQGGQAGQQVPQTQGQAGQGQPGGRGGMTKANALVTRYTSLLDGAAKTASVKATLKQQAVHLRARPDAPRPVGRGDRGAGRLAGRLSHPVDGAAGDHQVRRLTRVGCRSRKLSEASGKMLHMEFVTVVLALIVGVVGGALACWLVLRRRSTPTDAGELTAARSAAAEARLESANARADAANARSEAAAARTEAAKADTEIERARVEAAAAREDRALALADVAGFEAMANQAKAERDAAVERAKEIAADRQTIIDQFKLVSTEALEHQGKSADASAEQRLKATEQLMSPVRETLESLASRLTQVEKERAAMAAELKQQVLTVQTTGEQLRVETSRLTNALRKPHVRGAWGEVQLRRVVELAGMVEHCDFTEQTTAATDDRAIRPDLRVSMAAEKYLYVDSKMPLSGFLDAQEAPDEQARATALGYFARNVKGHVDALASKQYWRSNDAGTTPEFVVMFIPSEALFAEALQQLPDLLEHAAQRGVVLATPSSLIGLLRAISFGWKQEALAASAREIADLGRDLHKRLGTMGSHIDKLGRAIRGSVTAYNDAIGALESRVMVTARKLRDYQVTEDEIEPAKQVELSVRELTAPELVEDAVQVEPMIGRDSRRALARSNPEIDLLQRGTPDVEELSLFDLPRRQGATGLIGGAAQG